MTKRIYVDRSRYETYGRCPRSRFEQYHRGGVGIDTVRRPLPLCVGGSVHVGLADMLDSLIGATAEQFDTMARTIEEEGVAAALRDFAQYARVLELPDAEAAALATTGKYFDAASVEDAAITAEINKDLYLKRASEVDEYLFAEQSALVEALVRAYARRRLRPLLEQFEVLEVEREGEWKLAQWTPERIVENVGPFTPDSIEYDEERELWFMSRLDALLRERESNQLYLLSYKTTGSWDVRKARDAEHDMQGMSEGVEVERRLAEWWSLLHATSKPIAGEHTVDMLTRRKPWSDQGVWNELKKRNASTAVLDYLEGLDAPPRIHAVRYEYMLKGERWKDKELSARFGVEMRSQKSHLIRQYVAVSVPQRGAAGYSVGDVCWSWDYVRDDGSAGSLAWQNWKSRAVYNVREWIDKLDEAAECMSGEDSTVGLEPRLLGYKSDAQAVGVTREHPLDAVFIPPVTVYRSEDELRDLVDQLEAVERRIAEGVAAVEACGDDAGERRHALNVHFPQNRRACEYPTTCGYSKICYGGEDIRRDPLSSGIYKIRIPNHPQEAQRDKG